MWRNRNRGDSRGKRREDNDGYLNQGEWDKREKGMDEIGKERETVVANKMEGERRLINIKVRDILPKIICRNKEC